MIRRDSAQGVSRTSFPVSFRTRIGAINQRGRLYRLQTWSWWLGTVRKSWCNAWVFPTWTTSLASSLAPLAAIKGHQNCCNHRLGVFKTVSRVLGIYKGIPRTCLSLQLFFFLKDFCWWDIFQDYLECYSRRVRSRYRALCLSFYKFLKFCRDDLPHSESRLSHENFELLWRTHAYVWLVLNKLGDELMNILWNCGIQGGILTLKESNYPWFER